MSDQAKRVSDQEDKIVVLKFRTRKPERQKRRLSQMPDRFSDIDQVLEDIISNEKLRCA